MSDIRHLVKIRAPREQVYSALTTADGIHNWWTRDANLDNKIGGRGEFRFAKGTRVTTVSIEELQPSSRVVWKVRSAPIPTWAGTRIEFELRADDGGTLLAFAHRGFPEADDLFAYSNTAWGQFIISLHQYLETGKGTPHPDDPLSLPVGAQRDFRLPTGSKWQTPRAVADGGGGTIIATAEVAATPERVFRAFTTDEVERWWQAKGFYHWENWKAELRVGGAWSVTVVLEDGSTNGGHGEFAEIDAPHKLVMTRRFDQHPLQGEREDTITYRFELIANGTRVTVRDEGYVGRGEAAYGNAEHWQRVLGWLAVYFEMHRSR